MKTNISFLISTLAEYQTEFWLNIGLELKDREVECKYLSFDDRSTEMLRAAGFKVYSFSEMPETVDLSGKNAAATVTVSETSQQASLTHFSATNTLDISEALWQEFLSGQLTVVGNGNTIDVYQAGTGKALFHLEADHAIDYVGVAQQADGSVHLTL